MNCATHADLNAYKEWVLVCAPSTDVKLTTGGRERDREREKEEGKEKYTGRVPKRGRENERAKERNI